MMWFCCIAVFTSLVCLNSMNLVSDCEFEETEG